MGRRGRCFGIGEVRERAYKLDAFKWIRDEELDDPDESGEPEELIAEAMEGLRLAMGELEEVQRLLEGAGAGA